VPRCDPHGDGSCASLAEIPHGTWHSSGNGSREEDGELPVSYAGGATNSMTCDSGYSLVGDKWLTCINEQWDNPLPRCDSLTYDAAPCDCEAPSSDVPPDSWIPIDFPSRNQLSCDINIGFDFGFYGRNYSHTLISPNGFLTFDTTATDANIPSGTVIPNSNLPFKSLIAYWATNLDSLADGASTKYASVGHEGSRKFVLSLSSVPCLGASSDTPTLSCEVALYETENRVQFYYHNAPASTQPVTVGIQDSTGTQAQAALYNGEPPVVAVTAQGYEWQQSPSNAGPNWVLIGCCIGAAIFVIGAVGIFVWRHKHNATKRSSSSAPTATTATVSV